MGMGHRAESKTNGKLKVKSERQQGHYGRV